MITSRSTFRLNAWRQRATLEIMLPAAAAFLAMAGVVLLLLANTAAQVDLVTRQAEEERARNALDYLKQSMTVMTGSYGFSDRAFAELVNPRIGDRIIKEELAGFVYSTFGWSNLIVLSPHDEALIRLDFDAADESEEARAAYLPVALSLSDRLRSTPEVWTPGAIAQLVEVHGDLYLVVAAAVHPKNLKSLPGEIQNLPVLVSFADVNGPLIKSFFNHFGFGKFRATKSSGIPEGDAAIAFPVQGSRSPWKLHWEPKTPGAAIWSSLLPWLFVSMGALGVLMSLILWRALALSGRLRMAVIRTAEAQAASREKDKFMAVMSHELRTPLNAIIGFSDLMANEIYGAHSSPEYGDFARDILLSGQQLLAIIDDILTMSQLSGGNYPIEIGAMDAASLAEAAAKSFRTGAQGDVPILLHLPAEPVLVLADRRGVLKVLQIALSNAVKFSRDGTPAVLDVSGSASEGSVRFTIKDQGIGIPEDYLVQLGQPFTQVEGAYARSHGGLGLGLAIAQAFVTLLKGSLDIESREGEGTTVTVTLPAAAAATVRKAA